MSAIDHGFFNEYSFLAGIENIERAVATVASAAPDAIQLSVGQARHLQKLPGRFKPSLVLRIDVANVYGRQLPRKLYSRTIDDPVGQALRLDAACMCVNLFQIPNEPEVGEQCIENILRLKPESERCGMPMMIEPLVFQANEKAGGYMVDGDEKKIIPLVRQAAELGADVIKADPTDNVSLYHKVIEAASGVPVLVRGGGKVGDREILQRTHELLAQGASGIRLRSQHHSARQARRDHEGADEPRPRRRLGRHGGGVAHPGLSRIDPKNSRESRA
jgi:DhnA family fructose-bisphosphate aldolase class Ia